MAARLKYIIKLTEEEREQLEAVARGKKGRLKIAAEDCGLESDACKGSAENRSR